MDYCNRLSRIWEILKLFAFISLAIHWGLFSCSMFGIFYFSFNMFYLLVNVLMFFNQLHAMFLQIFIVWFSCLDSITFLSSCSVSIKGAIKSRQSRGIDNIGYTRHRKKTNKTKITTQKTKKKSNMAPPKTGVESRC